MSMIQLKQVWLVNPIGPTRDTLAMTSPMAGNQFLMETDFYHGQISDVAIYRNKYAENPERPAVWEWFVGIPVTNIKAYTIAGKTPQPVSLLDSGEQETTLAATGPTKAGTAASA